MEGNTNDGYDAIEVWGTKGSLTEITIKQNAIPVLVIPVIAKAATDGTCGHV